MRNVMPITVCLLVAAVILGFAINAWAGFGLAVLLAVLEIGIPTGDVDGAGS